MMAAAGDRAEIVFAVTMHDFDERCTLLVVAPSAEAVPSILDATCWKSVKVGEVKPVVTVDPTGPFAELLKAGNRILGSVARVLEDNTHRN